MEQDNLVRSGPSRVDDLSAKAMTNRRGFLGAFGAAGLAALSGGIPEQANASTVSAQEPSNVNLSSLDDLKVTREENFEVPNGKETFLEWQVADKNKRIIKKFMTHHARVDADGTYTMTTDIKINTYKLEDGVTGIPISSNEQHATVFATKGEPIGSIREDRMIVTSIHNDGTTTRQVLTVPVRLDTSEFDDMNAATLIGKLGAMHLSGERP